jgi:hypothetical protein
MTICIIGEAVLYFGLRWHGRESTARKLLHLGADVNVKVLKARGSKARLRAGLTPLHFAAGKGHLALVKLFLDASRVCTPGGCARFEVEDAKTIAQEHVVNAHSTPLWFLRVRVPDVLRLLWIILALHVTPTRVFCASKNITIKTARKIPRLRTSLGLRGKKDGNDALGER